MKKALLLTTILITVLAIHSYAQPNIFNPNDSVVTYKSSKPPTMPKANTMAKWVRTVRMSWNTDRFKPYYWNGMAFRLRYPNNYDPAKADKYPILIFFHGAGEIAPVTDNENQLVWAAQPFEAMMNAGTAGGFNNAFLLFPQAIQSVGWQDSLYIKVNGVLDSLQKYCNVDPDRVVAQGLSNGGFGALSYSTLYPTRVATTISASPALVQNLIYRQGNALQIPVYMTSGGLDNNPDPPSAKMFVDSFAAKGGNIRYILYPNLGHNTWSQQWLEPYLVPYWTAAYKSNPLLYFQRSQFCSDSAFTARMGLTPGFYAYQWAKDGGTIPNATSSDYSATQFGSYTARFKRTASSDWSVWSPNPIVITATPGTITPPIQITGISSKVLPATDGSTTTPLELPAGFNAYEWRNATTNAIVSTSRTYAAPAGLVKARAFGCNANYSNFTIIPASGSPKPDSAFNLALTRVSPTSIKLTWSNKANPAYDETGFEVYRGQTASGPYTLATITAANVLTYTDTSISDNYNYYYRIRAVNDNGAAPLSNQVTLQPGSDNSAPTVPANVKAVLPGRTAVQLTWDKSSDNVGVTQYELYVNGVKKFTTSTNIVTATGLTSNISYNFKVKALDQTGNASAFSDSIKATTVIKGLKYSYYEGSWTMLPNFSTLTPVKIDTSANVNIAKRPAGVDNYFAFVWEGWINIKTPGTYTFETNSDDGSKLYFNTLYDPAKTELVNNDGSHGPISATGSVKVDSAGMYPITITYFEKDAGESMNVYWSGPGLVRQPISDAAFTENFQLPVDNTAPTKPGNLTAAYAGRTFVDLTWDSSTDNIGVTKYDVYVNGVKKYSTTTNKFTADSLDANTNYTIMIKALDLAANASAFSDSVKINTTVTNLKYRYYQGSWTKLPDFSQLTPTQSGTTSNTLLKDKPSPIKTNFGFVWEGYINIQTAGDYTFETGSDDGSKLYFDQFYSPYGIALVDNDGQHGSTPTVAGTVTNVTPGMHPITITYFQNDLSSAMNLYWTGPGILRQAIPDSAFTEKFSLPGDKVAPSKPASVKTTYVGRNFTDIIWNSATDNVGVAGYDVYVNGTKKYTTTDTTFTVDNLNPNTVYYVKVKAFDYKNNNSAFSDSVKVTTGAVNLRYRYFEGSWDKLPDFNVIAPVKTGTSANVDISVRPGGVVNNYGFVWEGYINIKSAGDYTFETQSDDGSKFYFNGFYSNDSTAVADNDGTHGAIVAKGTVRVNTPGLYPISITYFQKEAGASMNVYWSGPGIARQLIPDSAFTENYKGTTDNVAPTKPGSLTAKYTGRTFVELAWNKSTDNFGVAGYDVYINGTRKYSTADTTIKADSLIAGTAYTFKVKAYDFNSNGSAFSDSVKVTTGATNLKYRYYEGAWDSLPNFNALLPVKTGTSANTDISVRPAGVVNNYGIVWEGYINIKKAGTYTFETQSDDGSKLYFNKFYSYDSVALANNDGLHGAIAKGGSVDIAAPGLYPIAITYFQREAGASMQAYWTGPGIARQLIPDAAFTESYSIPGDNTAPSAVTNVKPAFTTRTFIDLAWNKATDNVGVTGYDVYVNGTKKYTTADTTVHVDSLTVNAAYTFKVKAFDAAGNVSAFGDSAKITTAASGLRYKYYETPSSWSVLPNFSTLTPVKTGSSANFDLSPKVNNDNFGFVWEGYLYIKTPGTYTFETQSDDGSKFYFNTFYNYSTTATVDNDGQHGAIVKTGTVNIPAAGWYPVTATFFDATLDESIKVFWTGPGIARQQIPDAAFVEFVGSDVTAPSAVTNVKSAFTARTFVDLAWNKATDNVGVTGYDVYVNGTKRYTTADTTVHVDSLTVNAAYTFKVKAFDAAGNVSAFGDSAKITTAASGLRYKYYETPSSWSVLPNFSTLTPVKTGSSANFDLSPKVNNDNFGFVWEGYLYIKTPGTYTFETQSDDGSKFYFNTFYNYSTTATVDNDGQHGAIVKTGTVNIPAAGWYPVTATFFDATLDESIKVFWTGPGIARQQIPDAAFVEFVGSDVTAPSAVTNVKSAFTARTFVDLAWNKATDNVGVTGYDVYVNGTKRYTTADTTVHVDSLTVNAAYTFKVKAFDAAGNVSAFGDSAKITTAASGLRYKYYETPSSWSVLPNFSTLTPVKTGSSANFDLSPKVNNDNFGFVWEGYLYIKTPGTYTFETQSDDGSKFYFNTFYNYSTTATVDNDGQHGAIVKTGTVNIPAAGWYPVTATFFDATLDESIKVFWTGPGIARQQIPDAAFVEFVGSDVTAPSAVTNVKSAFTARTFVDLAWNKATDNVGVTGYDVYVNGTKKYSTIDTTIKVDSLTAGAAYTFKVKAFDAAGNVSAFGDSVKVTAAANGLRYKYYETPTSWSVLPNFSTLNAVKTGTTPNVDLTPRTSADNFGFVWEGYIHITTPGTYTFETQSDDGSKLYFNSFYNFNTTATVDNDGQHGAIVKTGTVTIPAAGWYPIAVTFFDATLDESIKIYWSSNTGLARQLIPNSAFTESASASGDDSTAVSASSSARSAATAESVSGAQVTNAYPNPFNEALTISYFSKEAAGNVDVELYDQSGRMVYSKHYGHVSAGATTFRIDLGGQPQLKTGTYFARLNINGKPVKTWTLIRTRK